MGRKQPCSKKQHFYAWTGSISNLLSKSLFKAEHKWADSTVLLYFAVKVISHVAET